MRINAQSSNEGFVQPEVRRFATSPTRSRRRFGSAPALDFQSTPVPAIFQVEKSILPHGAQFVQTFDILAQCLFKSLLLVIGPRGATSASESTKQMPQFQEPQSFDICNTISPSFSTLSHSSAKRQTSAEEVATPGASGPSRVAEL